MDDVVEGNRLTPEQQHWLKTHMTQEDTKEVMQPLVTMFYKCKATGMFLGGVVGVGSWFLLDRDAPDLRSAYRFFFSCCAFNLGYDFGHRWGLACFLRPHTEEQARIMVEIYRKYRREESTNTDPEEPTGPTDIADKDA
ncbi:hypothetical protein AAVH_08161 [Aphelenchoides avenae]|nr:hypothetical protein AAVH_08161 [Aphelenchus avenae]